MDKEGMRARTKLFALRIMKMADALPNSAEAWVIKKQIIRCGTSVGANYRASCRSRSTAEFIAKLGIVEEEVDECGYWLEIIVDRELLKKDLMQDLIKEADQITAIIVSTIKSTKRSIKK